MCADSSTDNMLGVRCHVSQPQPRTLPLLTPPVCTAGWFTKTQKQLFVIDQGYSSAQGASHKKNEA